MKYGLGLVPLRWLAAPLGLGLAITACSDNSNSGFGSTSGTGGTGVIAGGGQNSGTNVAVGGDGQTTDPNAAVGGTTGSTTVAKTNWVSDIFGCKFAWGAPYWEVPVDTAGKPDISYLQFVSQWLGQEANAGLSSWSENATNPGTGDSCWVCDMVKATASTNVVPTFYTYVIGGQAKEQGGFGDCNTDSDGHNLCSDGAQWIRDNRAQVINAYAQYAKLIQSIMGSKPAIWWLEGDYIQYTYGEQSKPLTYAEAGQLVRDIISAIKANQPSAVVGVNHSPWITDGLAQMYWTAMPVDIIDLVWVQAAGDSDTFPNSNPTNAGTANYAWLHQKTGLPIMAETSYGAPDRWMSSATEANVNERIANGVVGTLINFPKSAWTSAADFTSKTSKYAALSSTCN